MKKTIFLLIIIYCLAQNLKTYAKLKEEQNSECILCSQIVPLCKPNEEIVPQTCHKCSHCRPIDEKTPDCVKCRFNFDCITGYVCTNDCCTERSLSSKRQKAIKKIMEDSKPSGNIASCKNPCGIKCCNHRQKCIVIDQCKGRKTKCSLPVLKYCSTKVPEPINGRVQPL